MAETAVRLAAPIERGADSRGLGWLYKTAPGRVVLKLLTARWLSRAAGWLMDRRISKPLIPAFVKKANIDLKDFYADDFRCFNDCFTRKIREGLRPVDMDPGALIAPCDGLMSAYPIRMDTVIPIKQSRFSIPELLGGDEAAGRFQDGICLVFRLCVDHYHRYAYPDSGAKGENVFIPGKLHTVRPIALDHGPVFTQNCREYTLMETENLGLVAQVEVGAMLVGRIRNHHGKAAIHRGEEKGMFLYGGSTVVMLLEKDRVSIPEEAFAATRAEAEIPIKLGQRIGTVQK